MNQTLPRTPDLLLASGSVHRLALLQRAGVLVRAEPSGLDERALEAPLTDSGADAEDIAAVLAEAKACAVSERHPNALVIGADQTLSLDDTLFHKPRDMDDARRTLLALSAKTHVLSSAVVLASGGTAVWRHVALARLTMRPLDPAFIGRYLARVGPAVLTSVGAYQIEAEGVQLMTQIEGDLFTIVGLPLLPLLAELRTRGAIDG